MKITLLYFAQLREKKQRDSEVVELKDGIPVRELLTHVFSDGAERGAWAKILRIAVNQEYADPGLILHANDEVALIPPVAGG